MTYGRNASSCDALKSHIKITKFSKPFYFQYIQDVAFTKLLVQFICRCKLIYFVIEGVICTNTAFDRIGTMLLTSMANRHLIGHTMKSQKLKIDHISDLKPVLYRRNKNCRLLRPSEDYSDIYKKNIKQHLILC